MLMVKTVPTFLHTVSSSCRRPSVCSSFHAHCHHLPGGTYHTPPALRLRHPCDCWNGSLLSLPAVSSLDCLTGFVKFCFLERSFGHATALLWKLWLFPIAYTNEFQTPKPHHGDLWATLVRPQKGLIGFGPVSDALWGGFEEGGFVWGWMSSGSRGNCDKGS